MPGKQLTWHPPFFGILFPMFYHLCLSLLTVSIFCSQIFSMI